MARGLNLSGLSEPDQQEVREVGGVEVGAVAPKKYLVGAHNYGIFTVRRQCPVNFLQRTVYAVLDRRWKDWRGIKRQGLKGCVTSPPPALLPRPSCSERESAGKGNRAESPALASLFGNPAPLGL